jgi:tRNA-dihydrouridine synthase
MKEFIGKYQKAIVGTGAVAVLLICYLQQKELAKLRADKKIEVVVGGDIQKAELIDSLQSELFVKETMIGRYEVALELLKEQNPKAADEFELILSTKTE